ncbi:MAG: protein kinase domain-containing protein, partial [Anaerolineae bacterium]
MTLNAGQMLQNRYRIVSRLGEGGMGAVYRAWDTRLNAPIALKEMRPQSGLAPQALSELREQFHQEAAVLARLNHPNLVRVSDFFDEGGNTYLVMAFVEGQSLADYIAEHGSVPESQVKAWGVQLLDALAYCHRRGIIHRDIKPQNVILNPEGEIVLVDFGLVKLWNPNDPRTRTAIRSMGTPQYAPPEQYDSQMGHTDPRSDIYSVGATLYHALTGKSPPTATMRIVNPRSLIPVRQLNPQVSPQIEAVLQRALALQPEARFQNAAEMKAALQGQSTVRAPIPPPTGTAVMGEGVQTPSQAPPPSDEARSFPWLWVAIIAGALLLFGTVGGGVMAFRAIMNRDSTPTPTQVVAEVTATETREPTTTAELATEETPIETEEAPTSSPKQTATATLFPTSTSQPTVTAFPTSTPLPTATATPTEVPTPICPDVSGPFAGIWSSYRDELGCAQGDAYTTYAAHQTFQNGYMIWREDRGAIYALYGNGSWNSYADTWVEGTDPTYYCPAT